MYTTVAKVLHQNKIRYDRTLLQEIVKPKLYKRLCIHQLLPEFVSNTV